MLRVGDLVLYRVTVDGILGVFLGEEPPPNQFAPSTDRINEFFVVWSGKTTTTLAALDFLWRIPLPDDPRSTPARGDPT